MGKTAEHDRKQRSLLQFFVSSAAPASRARQSDASAPAPKVFPNHESSDSAADQQLPAGETSPPSTHAASTAPAEGADGDGDLPSAADASSPDEENVGPNAYEQERLERIRRNQEKMRSLGLGPGGFAMLSGPTPKTRPAVRKKRPPPEPPTAPDFVRCSARHKPGGGGSGPPVASAAPRPAEEPPELHYNDSSVQRYVCDVLAGGGGASGRAPGGADARVIGFARLLGLLHDSALARAYSVDWRPGLVVAGGKDGQVSLWGSQALEEGALGGGEGGDGVQVAPLLSHRLHRGWLSDVQFCSSSASTGGLGGGGGSVLLLTAGNDGCVCLWDVTKSAAQGRQELPLCLAKAGDIHSGGVFSMHEAAQRIVTASKDCSVAVSAVREGGALCMVQRYDDLHDGVVKCARWRGAYGSGATSAASSAAAVVFASCGNDRRVRVVDTRQGAFTSGAAAAAIALQGGHSTAVNCVRWSPASEHILLSASHDPHILLHDLRAPGQALHTLLGHSQERRINAIYQPAFVAGGKGVATGGGERGGTLSLYCTATGAAISRGAVELAIGATWCGGGAGDPLVCSATRSAALFVPRWEELSVG